MSGPDVVLVHSFIHLLVDTVHLVTKMKRIKSKRTKILNVDAFDLVLPGRIIGSVHWRVFEGPLVSIFGVVAIIIDW